MNTDHLANVPHHVYRYYNADNEVLYVGCTWDLAKRDREHQDKDWYPQVRRVEFDTFPDRRAGRLGEYVAIQRLKPIHNQQLTAPADPLELAFTEALLHNPANFRALYAAYGAYTDARIEAESAKYELWRVIRRPGRFVPRDDFHLTANVPIPGPSRQPSARSGIGTSRHLAG